MKQRHWVTIAVLLVVGAAVYGILDRLRSEPDSRTPGWSSPTGISIDSTTEVALEQGLAGQLQQPALQLPVSVAEARHGVFTLFVQAAGEAAARRSADLHALVEGVAVEVPVGEGERVAEGDLLLELESEVYELRVLQARANLEQARADYEDRVLFDEELPDDIRAERAARARVRAGLEQREAALAEAEYELAKTRITAPFAGIVANYGVAEQSRVRAGDSVAVLVDLSTVDFDAEVLHTDLPLLEVGRSATATFPALPGEVFAGRVTSINPLIDQASRTARVTVSLRNPEAMILPGMPGSVKIAGRELQDRVFVPKEAIVERNRRQVVFRFEPSAPGNSEGLAMWEYVTTGFENDTHIELVASPDPLDETFVPSPGDLVLVGGHVTLSHAARIVARNIGEVAGQAEIQPR